MSEFEAEEVILNLGWLLLLLLFLSLFFSEAMSMLSIFTHNCIITVSENRLACLFDILEILTHFVCDDSAMHLA